MTTAVRYDNPNPQPSPWLTALAGMLQGGAGQIGMNQANAAQEKENNAKYMSQIAVAMAQQNRLNPANPTGYNPRVGGGFNPVYGQGSFPMGGQQWQIGDSPTASGEAAKNAAETAKTTAETEKLNMFNSGDITASNNRALEQSLSYLPIMAKTPEEHAKMLEKIKFQQDYFKKNAEATKKDMGAEAKKNKAIKVLQDAGHPVTDANLKYVMDKM